MYIKPISQHGSPRTGRRSASGLGGSGLVEARTNGVTSGIATAVMFGLVFTLASGLTLGLAGGDHHALGRQAYLEAAERELIEQRVRKGGRPRRAQ